MKKYSEEVNIEAEKHPVLGAEYFEARHLAEKVLNQWKEEHSEDIAEKLIKPIVDDIYSRAIGMFSEYLVSDVESNIQWSMRDMVEKSVNALIGGKKYANMKYITSDTHGAEEVRKTLAKLHSDEIKDGRIADLEKEVLRLKEQVQFHSRQNY